MFHTTAVFICVCIRIYCYYSACSYYCVYIALVLYSMDECFCVYVRTSLIECMCCLIFQYACESVLYEPSPVGYILWWFDRKGVFAYLTYIVRAIGPGRAMSSIPKMGARHCMWYPRSPTQAYSGGLADMASTSHSIPLQLPIYHSVKGVSSR